MDESTPSGTRTQKHSSHMAVSQQQQPPPDRRHQEFRFPSQSAKHLLILLPTVPGSFLVPVAPAEAPRPSEKEGFVWARRAAFTQQTSRKETNLLSIWSKPAPPATPQTPESLLPGPAKPGRAPVLPPWRSVHSTGPLGRAPAGPPRSSVGGGGPCVTPMLQTARSSLFLSLEKASAKQKQKNKTHQEQSSPLGSRLFKKGSSPHIQEMKQKH